MWIELFEQLKSYRQSISASLMWPLQTEAKATFEKSVMYNYITADSNYPITIRRRNNVNVARYTLPGVLYRSSIVDRLCLSREYLIFWTAKRD